MFHGQVSRETVTRPLDVTVTLLPVGDWGMRPMEWGWRITIPNWRGSGFARRYVDVDVFGAHSRAQAIAQTLAWLTGRTYRPPVRTAGSRRRQDRVLPKRAAA